MSEIPGFGERLRIVIDRRAYTLIQVARRCGVERSTLSNWLTGKSAPRSDQLVRLCRGLECSADELLGLAPAPLREELLVGINRYVDEAIAPVRRENADLRRALNDRGAR